MSYNGEEILQREKYTVIISNMCEKTDVGDIKIP